MVSLLFIQDDELLAKREWSSYARSGVRYGRHAERVSSFVTRAGSAEGLPPNQS
jgi:hypothetical protein